MEISDRKSTKEKEDAEPTDIDEAYSASIVDGSLNSEDTTESNIFTEDFDISETVSIGTENTESTDIRAYSRESSSIESTDIEETIEEFLQSTVNWQFAFSLATDIVADISNKVTEHFTKIETIRESSTNLNSMKTENITIEDTESNDVDSASSESSVKECSDIKESKRKIKKFLELSTNSQIGFSMVNTVVADISDKVTEELIEIEKNQKSATALKLVETVNIKNCPAKTANITIFEPNDSDRANSACYVDEFLNKEDTLEKHTIQVEVPKTISAKTESTESTDVTPKSAKIEETCSYTRIEEQKDIDKLEESIAELNVAANTQISTPEMENTTTFETINVSSDCEVELAKFIDRNENVIEDSGNVEKSKEKGRKSDKDFLFIAKQPENSSKYKWFRNHLAKGDVIPSLVVTPSEKPKQIFKNPEHYKDFFPKSLTAGRPTSLCPPEPKKVPAVDLCSSNKEFIPKALKVHSSTSSDLLKSKDVSAKSLNLNSKEFVPRPLRVEPSNSLSLSTTNEVPIEPLKVEPLSSGLPKPKEVSAGVLNFNSKEFVPRLLRVEPSTSPCLPKPNEVPIEPLKVKPLSSALPKSKEVYTGSLDINSKEFVPKSLRVEPSTSSGLPKPKEVPIEPLKVKPLSSGLPKSKEVPTGSLNVYCKEFVPRSLKVEPSTSSVLPKPNEIPIEPLKVEPLSSGLPKPKAVSTGSLDINSKEFVPQSLRVEPSTSSGLPKPKEVSIEPLKVKPLSSDLPKSKEVSAGSLNLNSKEFMPRLLRIEPTSADLPKPKEVSAGSLQLNSKEFVPGLLRVEPSTSPGLPKPNEVPIEPLKVKPLSADLPKLKEVPTGSLNFNSKEFVPRLLRIEPTSADLPKPKEVSAGSLQLNSKEFVPRLLRIEPSTSSDLPKPDEVLIEPLKVEPLSSDLPKPKEIAGSLNLNSKEFVPILLRVEPSTSSDIPNPNEVSAESLNLYSKEFVPILLRVESSTSSDVPKLKEIAAEALNLNYKESLTVEPSISSDLPKPKQVASESLNLNYKVFAPRSLEVEPSTSSDLPKPEEVSAECLNLNYTKFAPRSLEVEPSTSSDLPKPEEVSAECLNLNYKEFASPSLRAEHCASTDLPILTEFSCSLTPVEGPVEVTSKVLDPKKVLTPEIPVHSFLATLDAVLLVLEGTLAGAYRISQNYTGPPIPLVIKNTMHSVRLSLETLRTHFGYTEQECFEPLSSILRDLLTPAVTLFSDICPELAYDIIDFYPALQVPEPRPGVPIPPVRSSRPEFVISPSNFSENTVYDRFPIPQPQCVPRIPLYTNSFEDDTKLGVFVTPDGFIRMLLPYTFEIDLTIDGAICVRNIKDKTITAISGCGNFSGMATNLCRVHQRGKVIEMRITDEFANKNMYAKIGVRGVYFGGTDTPANLHLKDNGETIVSPINFSDLDTDFIKDVFVNHSVNGPANYEACCTALKESKEKTLVDGSVHFCWKNIKITQYKNGEVVVNRKNGDFMIWCSPEVLNLYTGTEKKGIIKMVTPITRVVSTVMSTPFRAQEKFFLANLGNQWVYYNNVDFLASNEVHSAGYTDVAEENKAAAAAVENAENS